MAADSPRRSSVVGGRDRRTRRVFRLRIFGERDALRHNPRLADALASAPGSPFPDPGTGPEGVIVSAHSQFVYVANNGTNDISGYAMNAATCALAPLPGSPFADPGTNPIGVAI